MAKKTHNKINKANDQVTEEPVTEDPVVEDQVTEDPVVENQVTENPVVEDQVTENPVVEDQVTEDPLVEDQVTEAQITKEIVTESDNYTCKFLTQLQDSVSKVQSNVVPLSKKYALYFIGLEDDNMFLYLSYKKSNEQILYQCEQLYEYTKLFKPLKVVYTMDDCDLTDADKYVKVFMKMFGENSTRGGSYTDIILPEWQKNALDLEFETASIEKLDEIDAIFTPFNH